MAKCINIIICSLFLFSCNTKQSIYDGAHWGMSINDVQDLYKVKPSYTKSDELHYYEKLQNSTTNYKVTYKFDAREGLNEISINATTIHSETDKEDDVKNFEDYFINKQQVKLLDEALNFNVTELGLQHQYIYDRIYHSSESNIRSYLKKEEFMQGWYDATIIFIPTSLMWQDKPSQIKSNSQNKSK